MTALSAALAAAAREWIADDPDPATADALRRLLATAQSGDPGAAADLVDAFAGPLQFGTAGLRGTLGPGPNRMNRVVVARAAAGLARYLLDLGHGGAPVVVGFDARHGSRAFARDTAEVMAGAGLRPLLLPRPLPTPVLASAIRPHGAAAGVMVTASHNPAADNGYKVYLEDGAQVVAPADVGIAVRIGAVGAIATIPRSTGYETLGESVVDSYVARVAGLVHPDGPRAVRVAYTALHGVGSPLMRAALVGAGFPGPLVVAAQDAPDPDFPTVPIPNPEEPGAMDLVLALAREQGVDLVLANDPDADRCAVAVPAGDDGYRVLTGDEVGALLGWWLIERGRRRGVPVTGTFATTIVSSQLLGAIARAAGLGFRETLTGFKWISRAAADLVYGYEEALGYCVDPAAVRDKDGIAAGLLMAELVAALGADGRAVRDVLDELALVHGVHATAQVSLRFAAVSAVAAVMRSLRSGPPLRLGGLPVGAVEDLSDGAAGLPPTDGLRYWLTGTGPVADGRVIVRPSGTEPKIKAYVEVRAPVVGRDLAGARRAAAERLAGVSRDVRAHLTR